MAETRSSSPHIPRHPTGPQLHNRSPSSPRANKGDVDNSWLAGALFCDIAELAQEGAQKGRLLLLDVGRVELLYVDAGQGVSQLKFGGCQRASCRS